MGPARRKVSRKNSKGVGVAKEGTVLPPLSPSLFLSSATLHFVLLSTNWTPRANKWSMAMLACMADVQRGEGRGNLGKLTGKGGTLYWHAPAFKILPHWLTRPCWLLEFTHTEKWMDRFSLKHVSCDSLFNKILSLKRQDNVSNQACWTNTDALKITEKEGTTFAPQAPQSFCMMCHSL